jgi:hypothetical protein
VRLGVNRPAGGGGPSRGALIVHLAGRDFEKFSKLLGLSRRHPRSNGIERLPTTVGNDQKSRRNARLFAFKRTPSTAALDGGTADLCDQCREPATPQYEEWTKVRLDLLLVGVNCGRQMFVTDTKWQKNP